MLVNKKYEYKKGMIDKHKYMSDMFNIHKYLFEYPSLLRKSPISKIEITKKEAFFYIHNNKKNIKLCCDKRDAYSIPMAFMNLAEVETQETAMAFKLIKPGDVVFDIGANIGWFTINILLQYKDVSVYSFEPINSSFQYLKKNLSLNKLHTDQIFNFGLSDENKTINFYFDTEYAMASSMANLRENNKTVSIKCKVKKMDDFVKTINPLKRLDFIKCDVEGAELLVFKGGIKTIKQYKPIIFAEMLRKWSKKFGYHPNKIIKFFTNLGYKCYVIKNGRLNPFKTVDENTIETNYFFIHMDKKEILSHLQ